MAMGSVMFVTCKGAPVMKDIKKHTDRDTYENYEGK
jgi:hypothetical protein